MAIFGVGTDIIALTRVERSLERHGDKFAQRILSARELDEYAIKRNKVAYLAKRFAAKEAISKALGTGMREGIDFKQLIIINDELGKPCVTLENQAKDWAERHNIENIHLSISDEKDTAVAFAITEQLTS
ncbi:holo-ACP synthase [Kangiella marina]|uniref:Holo-[acyl-carrier-protein] synthase n=1 Tax=Kangiella marina TaxID=1079178 RepID=A0ABP8IMR2_9GAMM